MYDSVFKLCNKRIHIFRHEPANISSIFSDNYARR